MKFYAGTIPSACDLCKAPIIKVFVDGATRMGPWANMCVSCFRSVGRGRFGTGFGQRYKQQGDGRWLKTDG